MISNEHSADTGACKDPRASAARLPAGGDSIALRTALAAVSDFGMDASRHLPQIDHLTLTQLRQRALGDRDDAQAAAQRGSISAAAMMLNDAERCDARAAMLERDGGARPVLQKTADGKYRTA